MSKHFSPPSYSQLLNQAWPLMLANIAHPLLGIVDTAIMGHTGSAADLAALAVGALILNGLFWNCGFLRMSTTALVATDLGRNNPTGILATLSRAAVIAIAISTVIIVFSPWLLPLLNNVLTPTTNTQDLTRQYLNIRIFGTPAVLLNYVLVGYLIAVGRTRLLLSLQIAMNLTNTLLDIIFAVLLGWGIAGIALGTVIAEYAALLAGLVIILYSNSSIRSAIPLSQALERGLRDTQALLQTLSEYRNIWLRTLCLLISFFMFTRWGSEFGNTALAANHILLQIISFSAFFLDSYAHVTESYIGRSIGQKQPKLFDITLRRTSVLAAMTAILLGAIVLFFGRGIITGLTAITDVQTTATSFLLLAAIYIILSAGAFQLDGLFIGANATRAMRNASFAAMLIFLASGQVLINYWGIIGLWLAFIIYVVARGILLFGHLPSLRRSKFNNTGI